MHPHKPMKLDLEQHRGLSIHPNIQLRCHSYGTIDPNAVEHLIDQLSELYSLFPVHFNITICSNCTLDDDYRKEEKGQKLHTI